VPKCLKCGRETQIEGQICSECAKKIEDELSRRGVSKNISAITDELKKPVEDKDKIRFKNKITMWLLILIILGIAIGLLIYFYLGILKGTT